MEPGAEQPGKRGVNGGEAPIDYKDLPQPRDLAQPTRFAVLCLLASVALIGIGALFDLYWLDQFEPIVQDETRPFSATLGDAELAAIADDLDTASLWSLIAYLLSSVTFYVGMIQFSYQAYRNSAALGARGLRYGFHQVIWTWFVPVLSWFRPKQILNDIWRTSGEEVQGGGTQWRSARSVPGFLTAWWLLFLVVGFLSFGFQPGSWERADSAPAFKSVVEISIGVSVAWMLVTLMALFVVRRLADRQKKAFEDRARG